MIASRHRSRPIRKLSASSLKIARWHAAKAVEVLTEITSDDFARELDLAHAVRALRSIANYSGADTRSRGLAQAALRRLRLE